MTANYAILAAGTILILVLFFQVLSGLRVIKVSPKVHKSGGLVLLALAIIHAVIGAAYLLK